MIPTSQQQEFLGKEKTLLKAMKECVYLPGITEDVKQYIMRCDICQSARATQEKKPLTPHYVPGDPSWSQWEKVGIDLFSTSLITTS